MHVLFLIFCLLLIAALVVGACVVISLFFWRMVGDVDPWWG